MCMEACICVCKCARVCKCILIVQGFKNLRMTLLLLILKGTRDITLSEKSTDMWTSRTHQIWLFKFPTVFHSPHYSQVYVCSLPCLEIYKKFFLCKSDWFQFFLFSSFFSPFHFENNLQTYLKKTRVSLACNLRAAHRSWEGMVTAGGDWSSASAGRKERWMLMFNSLSS